MATKNDRALVEQALKRTDLVAILKHLFPIESHWQPKPESVARILKAWNVGPDSVVFVDDNPLELEQVKTAFPDMECLQFRKDDAAFLGGLRDRFAKREIREEDRLRVESLRANESLRQVESDPATLDALLATAEAKVKFDCSKQPPDPRALELINKTNQFNLNGARYSEADWKAYLADAATRLLVVTYEDRFGKLGRHRGTGGTGTRFNLRSGCLGHELQGVFAAHRASVSEVVVRAMGHGGISFRTHGS